MVLPRFVRQALSGEDLTVYGTGTQSRCFTHVLDTVHALVLLCDADGAIGNVYNVGPAEPGLGDRARGQGDRADGLELARSSSSPTTRPTAPASRSSAAGSRTSSALEELTGWTPSRTIDEMIDDVIAYEQSEARRTRAEQAPTPRAQADRARCGLPGDRRPGDSVTLLPVFLAS